MTYCTHEYNFAFSFLKSHINVVDHFVAIISLKPASSIKLYNDDSLELLGHNPLKSSYDRHMSTNITVPCINDDTALLFKVEMNEIEGID